jgi:hypothetical protein
LSSQTAPNPSVGSVPSASSPSPAPVFSNSTPVDAAGSQALTKYLHDSQLPLVGARVLASNGGPRQVVLYGFVATAFGKADAADQVRVFLNDPAAQIDNRIKIAPELANHAVQTPDATGAQTNNDMQAYQNQQALAQQQLQQYQQYQNGGSGMVAIPPLLSLFGSFGSFGGSGMSFGSGSSPFGWSGPGFGPYPPYPAYPPAGFGYPFPYSPGFP